MKYGSSIPSCHLHTLSTQQTNPEQRRQASSSRTTTKDLSSEPNYQSFKMATRALPRALRASNFLPTARRPSQRAFHLSATHFQKNKSNSSSAPPPGAGAFARTDDSITVEFPDDSSQLPSSQPVDSGTGRAGQNVFPTLATFSLQGKVAVVTGGARGLGLVMGQGIVVSGGDLAIVDLNSEFFFLSVSGSEELESI